MGPATFRPVAQRHRPTSAQAIRIAHAASAVLISLAACSSRTADPAQSQDAGADGGASDAAPDSGGTGGQSGGPCSGATCLPDEFCDWSYDWCTEKQIGTEGACRSRMTSCSATPVCACDGHVYETECAAYAAGVDIAGATPGGNRCWASEMPPGTFPCGPWYCEASTSYCYYGQGDRGDRSAECRSLPAACNGVGSCACLPVSSEAQCMTVEGNGTSGLLVQEFLQ